LAVPSGKRPENSPGVGWTATSIFNRDRDYAKVTHAKAKQLHETMTKLLPQIRYWIKTGFVAANKIVSLHIPELYSIVRGKAA
jgi:hypothetical protein